MSCRELEALFLSDAPPGALLSHRRTCVGCEALGRDLDLEGSLVSGLRLPRWSGELRAAILAIPARTVSCESAADLIAASLEEPLSAPDRERLDFHVSRCEGCAEAAATLSTVRDLVPPQPAPWVPGKMVASRPAPRRARRRWLFDPKVAIAFAYAATIVVMLLGWNPADLARRADVRGLEQTTKAAANVAGVSLVDRIGALQERAFRAVQVVKGRFGGYGRAVLSNTLNLVMKPEKQPPPSRPRSGEGKGAIQKNETEIATWRA